MEDNNQFINQQPQQPQEFTEPAYVAPVIPYKEKKSPAKWFIIGGTVLLAAAIGVVIFLLLSNGGSAYEKAEKAYFGALTKQFDNIATDIENKHTEITFNLNGDALAQDADDDYLTALLQGLSNFGFTTDTATNDKDILANIGFLLGGEKIIDMNTWYSAEGKNVIMQFPEISKYLFTFSAANAGNTSAVPQISEADMKIIEDALVSISDVYFDFVKKFPVTPGQSFVAGSNTYTGDLVTINLSLKDMLELLKQVSDKLINNNDLLVLVASNTNGMYTAEQLKTTLKTFADGGLDNITSLMDESMLSQTLFTMNVYFKGEDILYRQIDVPNICTICIYNVDDGTNFDQGITFTDSKNTSVIGLTNNYTVNNGAYTGTASIRVAVYGKADFNGTLAYKDFTLNENGINGTVTFNATDVPEVIATFSTTASGDNKTITGTLTVGGTEIASITGTEAPSTLAYQPAPEINADNSIIFSTDGVATGKIDEFTADLAAYFQNLAQTNPIFQIFSAMDLPTGGMEYFNPDDFNADDFNADDFNFDDFDGFSF